MSGPQTIRDYLAAFNAALEVGLRSRRRILVEVYDHLCRTAEEELRRGLTEEEAQRRAIAAFGSPEQVAAGFESGFLGLLDRRLAVTATRVDVWIARHPWGGAVLRTALFLPAAALIAGLGLAFAATDLSFGVAGWLVVTAALWSLQLGALARKLRGRPEPGLRARIAAHDPELLGLHHDPLGGVGATGCWMGALGGLAVGAGLSFLLYIVILILSLPPTLLAGALARNCAGDCETRRWLNFRREHPWWGALVNAAHLPSFVLALALALPAPLDFRLALALGITGMTAGLAALRCLAWNRHEKDWIEAELRDRSGRWAAPGVP